MRFTLRNFTNFVPRKARDPEQTKVRRRAVNWHLIFSATYVSLRETAFIASAGSAVDSPDLRFLFSEKNPVNPVNPVKPFFVLLCGTLPFGRLRVPSLSRDGLVTKLCDLSTLTGGYGRQVALKAIPNR